ncbi:hypothetical protein F5146DRAFT_999292 [Armillaria mellea]|nr:hypothetical protein F5146DRAFT_999292 [Armillaria mellea]
MAVMYRIQETKYFTITHFCSLVDMPVEGPLQQYTWSSCSGCTCSNHHIPIHVSKDGASPTNSIPDFNHLEHSNDPPLPGETETLPSMILDSEESIAAISKEIEEMKGLLSPVCHLPVEVLVLIFHETIQFPLKSDYLRSLNWDGFDLERPFDNPLWSIASVSRHWIFDLAPELHTIKTINIAYPSVSFILSWANVTHYENDYYFSMTAGPLAVDLLENLKAILLILNK